MELANSVVSILESCFPKTIDRLQKERSNLDGPKPMLLQRGDVELLFLVLFGDAVFKSQKKEVLLLKIIVSFLLIRTLMEK